MNEGEYQELLLQEWEKAHAKGYKPNLRGNPVEQHLHTMNVKTKEDIREMMDYEMPMALKSGGRLRSKPMPTKRDRVIATLRNKIEGSTSSEDDDLPVEDEDNPALAQEQDSVLGDIERLKLDHEHLDGDESHGTQLEYFQDTPKLKEDLEGLDEKHKGNSSYGFDHDVLDDGIRVVRHWRV